MGVRGIAKKLCRWRAATHYKGKKRFRPQGSRVMPGGGRSTVLDYLRHLTQSHPGTAAEDELLLDRFARHGDETAFTVLLQRHGPLVWGRLREVISKFITVIDAMVAFTKGADRFSMSTHPPLGSIRPSTDKM